MERSGIVSLADTMIADPDALDRVATTFEEFCTVLSVAPLDPALLGDEIIGHAGLARELREFAGLWQQRLMALRDRAASIAMDMRSTSGNYRDTDASAAQDFADLKPDRLPGARG